MTFTSNKVFCQICEKQIISRILHLIACLYIHERVRSKLSEGSSCNIYWRWLRQEVLCILSDMCIMGQRLKEEDAYINMWVLTLLRFRTKRIISLHPPPLACTGLSDKLSSPALFPLCYCIAINSTDQTVSAREKNMFKTNCHIQNQNHQLHDSFLHNQHTVHQ